jgi:uridine kinase
LKRKISPNRSFVVAIAGGTGSGKSYIAKALQATHPDQIDLVSHDSYYKDHSDMAPAARKFLNYDFPGAFDNDLFLKQLKALKSGEAVEVPKYSFSQHARLSDTVHQEAKPVIIVEGILVLSNAKLRKLYDLIIFIDVKDDIRLARRIERDTREHRDKNLEDSLSQYLHSAQPMHDLYVQPGREHAHLIINNNGSVSDLDEALEVVKARLDEAIGICPTPFPMQPAKTTLKA